MKNKKILITAACIAVSVLCAACSGGSEKTTLNVYNWGDYIDPEAISMFEEETGIAVNYETFATNEDMYVKIKNGATDYDIIFPSDYMVEKMSKEDLLEKIDVSSLENYGNIKDSFKGLSYDKNNEYSVPYMWGTLGIVYNTDMVDDEVTSWDILWNEKYSGQIFLYNSQRDVIGMALKKLGYSLNTTDINELNEAKAALKEQMPLVLSYAGDDIKDKMIGNEGALALMYSGDAMYVMEHNESLAYAVPEEGSNYWFDVVAVPKGSQNKDAAMKFIDFLCRPDVALMNTEHIGYATPNEGAYEMLSDEQKNDTAYSPSEEMLSRCEVFLDLGEFIEEYDKAWTEILAGAY